MVVMMIMMMIMMVDRACFFSRVVGKGQMESMNRSRDHLSRKIWA